MTIMYYIRLYSIILFQFLLNTSCKSNREVESVLSVKAPESISCGVLSVWVGMKFKQERNGKDFVGLINCPEMYGNDFFEKGANYVLELKKDKTIDEKGVVINSFEKENLTTYYVSAIRKK